MRPREGLRYVTKAHLYTGIDAVCDLGKERTNETLSPVLLAPKNDLLCE